MSMHVYFFGGYLATSNDVEAWRRSVIAQVPDMPVTAFPYPEDATAGAPLERWHDSSKVAEQIKAEGAFAIIVGHSSGCAIANDVAAHALALGYTNMKVIALDGFRPGDKLLALPGSVVWSAECNGVCSLNYHGLEHCPNFKVYRTRVRQQWPLHFSLVNTNASDNYVSIREGYHMCAANLEVLELGFDDPTAPQA